VIVRTVLAAADSFAAIFDRNRFGIAIAAMIRIRGMAATLMYPMMRPAVAIPSPLSRPILRRIFAFDICPRMMAGIPARIEKHKRERIPKIRLAMALPSVCWSEGGCW
jgi:hypothetical protein